MKSNKSKVNSEDLYPGWYISYQIRYQKTIDSKWVHYMRCGFDTHKEASDEVLRIRKEKNLYSIEVVPAKVRKLKTPKLP